MPPFPPLKSNTSSIMNAIILAAGLGSRLRPLTNDRPKCLVPVLGTPMVEQQIRFLREVGITDITLVTGYRADKLDYLRECYGVQLVHNDQYDVYNNIYSLYLVRELLGDTYVLEGDVYMPSNCLDINLQHSTYFVAYREDYQREWGLLLDGNRVREIRPQDGTGYILSGISYWTQADAQLIRQRIESLIQEGDFKDLFWDDAVLQLQEQLHIECRPAEIFEIDTEVELRALEALFQSK